MATQADPNPPDGPGAAVVPFEAGLLMRHNPKAVIEEARIAATALKAVISQKPKPVIMNGEQYLEFEDWQTVARFYGITAGEDGDVQFVTMPTGAFGFKASSVARDADGRELSRATAFCLNDEEKWGERPKYEYRMVHKDTGEQLKEEESDGSEWVWEPHPTKPGKNRPKRVRTQVGVEQVPLFQLSSMAQTRANAKALSNVLRWVVVLAGYRATPAEEVQDLPGATRGNSEQQRNGSEAREGEVVESSSGPVRVGSGERAEAAGAEENPEYVGERPAAKRDREAKPAPASAAKVPCPQCKKPAGGSKFPKAGKTHYCYECKHAFDPSGATA